MDDETRREVFMKLGAMRSELSQAVSWMDSASDAGTDGDGLAYRKVVEHIQNAEDLREEVKDLL